MAKVKTKARSNKKSLMPPVLNAEDQERLDTLSDAIEHLKSNYNILNVMHKMFSSDIKKVNEARKIWEDYPFKKGTILDTTKKQTDFLVRCLKHEINTKESKDIDLLTVVTRVDLVVQPQNEQERAQAEMPAGSKTAYTNRIGRDAEVIIFEQIGALDIILNQMISGKMALSQPQTKTPVGIRYEIEKETSPARIKKVFASMEINPIFQKGNVFVIKDEDQEKLKSQSIAIADMLKREGGDPIIAMYGYMADSTETNLGTEALVEGAKETARLHQAAKQIDQIRKDKNLEPRAKSVIIREVAKEALGNLGKKKKPKPVKEKISPEVQAAKEAREAEKAERLRQRKEEKAKEARAQAERESKKFVAKFVTEFNKAYDEELKSQEIESAENTLKLKLVEKETAEPTEAVEDQSLPMAKEEQSDIDITNPAYPYRVASEGETRSYRKAILNLGRFMHQTPYKLEKLGMTKDQFQDEYHATTEELEQMGNQYKYVPDALGGALLRERYQQAQQGGDEIVLNDMTLNRPSIEPKKVIAIERKLAIA